jgi:hypothetical protein
MDPLEVGVILEYSQIKSQLSSLAEGFSDFLKEAEKQKIDASKLLNWEGMSSMNWSPIVSKLFSPANLIAFFSAMAATGIISALQLQAAGQAAAGVAGLTQTGGAAAGPIVTAGTTQILNQIGTLAGGTSDVANAFAQILGYVQQFGGTTQDAVTLTTQLGEALKTTGGVFSSSFDADFIKYLQNIGATTTGQIEQVIANLEASKQASDGQLASIDDVIQKTNDFVRASIIAGSTFSSVNEAIVRFGNESAANSETAQSMLAVATEIAQGNLIVSGELGISQKNFINLLNGPGGANAAWDTMEQKITALPINKTVADALGIPLAALQGALGFVTMKDKLDLATSSLTSFNGDQGLGYTKSQFDDILSDMDKFDIALTGLKDSLAIAFAPMLPVLEALTNLLTWVDKGVGATGGFLSSLFPGSAQGGATGGTIGIGGVGIDTLTNAIEDFFKNMFSGGNQTAPNSGGTASTAKVDITVKAAPGTSATTQTSSSVMQNGINNTLPGGGISTASGTPKTILSLP